MQKRHPCLQQNDFTGQQAVHQATGRTFAEMEKEKEQAA